MTHIKIDGTQPRRTFSVGTPAASFTFSWAYFDASDIAVYVGGTRKALGADYTVSGVGGYEAGYPGGTVTLSGTVSATTVTLVRRVPLARTIDLAQSGPLPVKALNTAFDRMTAQIQQTDMDMGRSIRAREEDADAGLSLPLAAERAGRLLGFDDAGTVSASRVTLSLVDSLAAGAEIAGGILAKFGPYTSDGTLRALAIGYPILRDDRLTVVVGGIVQGGDAYSFEGETISFKAPIPAGVDVYGQIQGVTATFSTIPVNSFWHATLSTADAASARTALGAAPAAPLLSAWAGLSTGAEQMWYATGSTTLSGIATAAFGRSLLGLADAAAAQAVLGLGSAAVTASSAYLPASGGTISGALTVTGNFTVLGGTTTISSQTVTISDNIIVLNRGEVGSGVTAGTAGIQIDRGTLSAYQFIFDESADLFRVGMLNNLQAVATREDTPTVSGYSRWNAAFNRFDTLTASAVRTDIGAAAATHSHVSTAITDLSAAVDARIAAVLGISSAAALAELIRDTVGAALVAGSAGTPRAGAYAWWTSLSGVNTGSTDVWVDRVAGYTLSQATTTSRPTMTVFGGVTCLDFDGSDDKIVSPAVHTFNGLSAMTIQMLVSVDQADVGVADDVQSGAAFFCTETGPYGRLYVSPQRTGLRWRFGTGQIPNTPSWSYSDRGTAWHVVTVVKNGVTERVYLNAALLFEGSSFYQTTANIAQVIEVGGHTSSYYSPFLDGRIAEILVYKTALTAADVAANVAFFSTRHAIALS